MVILFLSMFLLQSWFPDRFSTCGGGTWGPLSAGYKLSQDGGETLIFDLMTFSSPSKLGMPLYLLQTAELVGLLVKVSTSLNEMCKI